MAQTSAAKGAAQNKSANGIDPRRQAALDTALAQVEKSFGKGSAMRLGDRPEQDVEVIPTGSLALDMALGIGGLPKGRIVEIYGPESSGKTTLALHVVANAQKNGGVAASVRRDTGATHRQGVCLRGGGRCDRQTDSGPSHRRRGVRPVRGAVLRITTDGV